MQQCRSLPRDDTQVLRRGVSRFTVLHLQASVVLGVGTLWWDCERGTCFLTVLRRLLCFSQRCETRRDELGGMGMLSPKPQPGVCGRPLLLLFILALVCVGAR